MTAAACGSPPFLSRSDDWRAHTLRELEPAGLHVWKGMDTDLVIRARQGDEGAFASLAMAHGGRLRAVALPELDEEIQRMVDSIQFE